MKYILKYTTMKLTTIYSIRRILVFLLFTFFLFSSYSLFAKNVELLTAKKVALNIFSKNSGISKNSLQIKETIPVEMDGELVYNIFNFSPNGFIIISADDATVPVIGYGLDSNFSFDDAPSGLIFLLERSKNEIKVIKDKKLIANEVVAKQWEEYSSDQNATLKSYSIGSYLLETTWGQSSPYNQYCPLDPNTSQRSLVGCGAVALGQILHYWGCKVFPDGSITYTPESFTSPLTVNFYQQSYNWDGMNHTSGNTENAKLLYHCGVAIQMDYSSTSSGSWPVDVEWALENYFGFVTSGVLTKSNYTDNAWLTMLKADIDASRPVFYGGVDPTNGGHLWVVDGYNSLNQFHCNWGWSGQYNNIWYTLSSLSPSTYNYPLSSHLAIFGITPILDACSGLSGNDIVCSSNNSYSVTIPSTASVIWSKSGNLTQVGGNTGTTYTVYATSASGGAGSITATIRNSQGQTFLTRTKSVWAGAPIVTSITGTSTIGTYQPATYYAELSSYASLPDSYSWGTSPLPGVTITPNGQSASIMFTQPGWYQVVAKAHNACGWSSTAMKMVNVISGYSMAISPNPATGETTVELVNNNKEALAALTEWDYEIYDSFQGLKEKKTKQKAAQTKINTTNWKDGIYIVRAKIGDEIITEKLVVKH